MDSVEHAFGPSRGNSRASPSRPSAASLASGTKEARDAPTKHVAEYSWSHAHVQYLPNQARREAEDAISESKASAARWQQTAEEWEARFNAAERQRLDAEAEAIRSINEVSWASVQKATEYEDRIHVLEQLLEDERRAHSQELRRHEELAQEAAEQSTRLLQEIDERCSKAVAVADARAQDAEERAEATRRRCEAEVEATREQEEVRVADARRLAESRARECEDQKNFEINQMHKQSIQRHRAMEETLYVSGRQKSEALSEARRHVTIMELDMREARAIQEAETSRREGRLDEWLSAQRRQNTAFEAHHKGMLELEKGLHKKTMERTMQRVNRHLKLGDADCGGRETPTREVFKSVAGASVGATPRLLAGGEPSSVAIAASGGTSSGGGGLTLTAGGRAVLVGS